MFKIKICGITSVQDARLAAEAGADAIGLNFYAQSPRHVAADLAGEIARRLREDYSPDQVQIVAVFVNHAPDEILWTLREADLYASGLCLQLHGDEPPALLHELQAHGLGTAGHLLQATGHVPAVPVIRALRCPGSELAAATHYLEECKRQSASPQGVLIDAFQPGAYGGTGARADWAAVRRRSWSLPLILAGGLTPDNVTEAIATARPDAVDVASGVESAPGQKDLAKVRAFVAGAKEAFAALDR
ncbi:MAG TPA: phosphoribosylanthranilate isomerase [Pirellulaceae bacterium]|nr:phosphoribosylanthranilate isomerase [Pirellulaceae bacterium]